MDRYKKYAGENDDVLSPIGGQIGGSISGSPTSIPNHLAELRQSQQLASNGIKRKFVLRRRVDEEEARNSAKFNQGKLLQPLPMKQKRSFQQVARLAQQQIKAQSTGLTPLAGTSTALKGLNAENFSKAETFYSQKSNHQEFLQKMTQQNRTRSPTTIDDNYKPEVKGPQVKLDRKDISFIVNTGLVSFDEVTVFNNGTASIYYEWKKAENQRSYASTIVDPEQKFFCHHEKNVIKPGQSKRFRFAFISQVTGIFQEEWELKCEPPTVTVMPRLKLTGSAINVDELKEWRDDFDVDSLNSYVKKGMLEIIDDILDGVRTPTPPLPDFNDPEIARTEFESKNAKARLWFNPLVMKWWQVLEKDLYEELKMNAEEQYWDLDVKYIQDLIEKVRDEDTKAFFESRFTNYIELCRKPPIERSEIFNDVRNALKTIACNVPETADKCREEIGMWESVFRPPSDERDFTESEVKSMEDEKTKIKNEWIKRTKKKKWADDDDKKMNEDYRAAMQVKLGAQVYAYFDGFEQRDAYQRVIAKIQKRDAPEKSHFENLLRKNHLRDVDIDGKRIILRAHLKLSSALDAKEKYAEHVKRILQEKDEEAKRIEEEKALQEKQAKDKKKAGKRVGPAGGGVVAAVAGSKVKGEGGVAAENANTNEKRIDVSFLDEDCLADLVDSVKNLLERQVKLVVLMVSYDDMLGEYRLTSSLAFLCEYLKTQMENTVVLNENNSVFIENFNEKIDTEFFAENSVLVLENAYFAPEEVGFKIVSVEKEEDDEEGEESVKSSLVKLTLDDKKEFIEEFSQYGHCLVVDDKVNVFTRNCTSLVNLHCENQVLGLHLSDDLQFVGHMITFDKSPFHAIIGGSLSAEKLIAIDTLVGYADVLVLLGEIGIKFLVVSQELQSQQQSQQQRIGEFPGFKPSEIEKKAITALIGKMNRRGKEFKLVLPRDFVIVADAQIEGVAKLSPSWIEKQIADSAQNFPSVVVAKKRVPTMSEIDETNAQQVASQRRVSAAQSVAGGGEAEINAITLDYASVFPQGYVIIDFGEATQEALRGIVRSAKKLLWIDSLSLYFGEKSNAANVEAARTLAKLQREKRERLEVVAKNNPEYDFSNDILVFASGKTLAKSLKLFDLNPSDKKKKKHKKNSNGDQEIDEEEEEINEDDIAAADQENDDQDDDGEEEDNKSLLSTNTAVAKVEAVRTIADFFSKDTEFILRVIEGEYIEGIAAIEGFDPAQKDDINDDLSFLDLL